jgi:ATP-dependent Lon protease
MKLLFPGGGATEDEIAEMLGLALESRKRVKDQLARIDSTYPATDFSYTRKSGQKVVTATLEEREFPDLYHRRQKAETAGIQDFDVSAPEPRQGSLPLVTPVDQNSAVPGHRTFDENQKGISFERLFWPYLVGASRIVLTDPYIRMFHQLRNLMELIEMIAIKKPPEQELAFHLITGPDESDRTRQEAQLASIAGTAAGVGITFTWEIDTSGELHARHIVTDTGWHISLDRGLDIFQKVDLRDAFSLATRQQIFRPVRRFEVIYVKT